MEVLMNFLRIPQLFLGIMITFMTVGYVNAMDHMPRYAGYGHYNQMADYEHDGYGNYDEYARYQAFMRQQKIRGQMHEFMQQNPDKVLRNPADHAEFVAWQKQKNQKKPADKQDKFGFMPYQNAYPGYDMSYNRMFMPTKRELMKEVKSPFAQIAVCEGYDLLGKMSSGQISPLEMVPQWLSKVLSISAIFCVRNIAGAFYQPVLGNHPIICCMLDQTCSNLASHFLMNLFGSTTSAPEQRAHQ
jgi:hypothetical protein